MKSQPRTPPSSLTPLEVGLVQESFRAVERQSRPAAERFFRELFSYDGSLRAHFARDHWNREEDLMTTLRTVLGQLGRGEELTGNLSAFAARCPAYLQSNYHHLYVGAALFSMLETVLGAGFNSAVYAAWFKVFELMVNELRANAVAKVPAIAAQRTHLVFAHPTAA